MALIRMVVQSLQPKTRLTVAKSVMVITVERAF